MDYRTFEAKCKAILNKSGMNFTKKQKLIVEAIYHLKDGLTDGKIASHIMDTWQKTLFLGDVATTIKVLEQAHLLDTDNQRDYRLAFDSASPRADITCHKAKPTSVESEVVHSFVNGITDKNAIFDDVHQYFPDADKQYVEHIIDAYNLLIHSIKVSEAVKNLLSDVSFIDQNESLILSLAKLYFQADSIELENNENIVIRKEVLIPRLTDDQAPKINETDLIRKVLQKVKYDKLRDDDIIKLSELRKYQKYQELSALLLHAIDCRTSVKTLDDSEMTMGIFELKRFLETL